MCIPAKLVEIHILRDAQKAIFTEGDFTQSWSEDFEHRRDDISWPRIKTLVPRVGGDRIKADRIFCIFNTTTDSSGAVPAYAGNW